MTEGQNPYRLEVAIGRLLAAGVVFSSACLVVGLIATLWWGRDAGRLPLTIGILALLATPVVRVVASSIDSTRRRDWLYVLLTLIVLAELVGSVIVARQSVP